MRNKYRRPSVEYQHNIKTPEAIDTRRFHTHSQHATHGNHWWLTKDGGKCKRPKNTDLLGQACRKYQHHSGSGSKQQKHIAGGKGKSMDSDSLWGSELKETLTLKMEETLGQFSGESFLTVSVRWHLRDLKPLVPFRELQQWQSQILTQLNYLPTLMIEWRDRKICSIPDIVRFISVSMIAYV